MFGFNFGETYEVIFEIYVGEQCVNRQSMQSFEMMLKQQFMQLVRQLANEDKPMMCKMIYTEFLWNDIEKKNMVLENYVEFRNKLYEDKEE